ncbi:MAG: TonB-dependent receptor [Pseudomonadales bacterium]|nr:TonB-dependent receptor [Pseudomonadales bacterium]
MPVNNKKSPSTTPAGSSASVGKKVFAAAMPALTHTIGAENQIRRPASFRSRLDEAEKCIACGSLPAAKTTLHSASTTPPLANRRSSPALGLALGLFTTTALAAGESGSEDDYDFSDINTIELIEVYGQPDAQYKAIRSGDKRHLANLADTPQTMTMLTQTQIQDSGKSDLKEILAAQAGITLGTGENGNAFGDRYIIRGHEARSDVFVDGVRDPGMTTRESFATEQIEITKGPSSTFAGRGSTGGAVNGITKQASADYDFVLFDGGFGTDQYRRLTVDGNKRIGDNTALRVNLLSAREAVPDREPASRERQGALVSLYNESLSSLRFTFDYYHLEAADQPDLGSFLDPLTRRPVSDIPVYLQNSDFLDSQVDTYTLRTDYYFDDNLSISNALRYGETGNAYVTTGARGSFRDITDPQGSGAPTITLSGHQGWQEVEYLINQLNLFWNKRIGGLENKIVAGLEYSDENVLNGTFTLTNTGSTNCILPGRVPRGAPAGTVATPTPGYCATDPSGQAVAGIGKLLDRKITRTGFDADYHVRTVSAYLMDHTRLNDHWSAFFGLRYDRFDYANQVQARDGSFNNYRYDDGFWNGHAGVVRKLGEQGNVYLTWSTATNINGGESDVGGSCGYGGLCGTPEQVASSEPEHTSNFELGSKWQLFNNRLLLTAAAFLMNKDDVMESVGDAYSTIGTLNTGSNRIQGIEFTATGSITDKLSAQFSAAVMSSRVTDSFTPDNEGLELSNFAGESAFLQLRYQATPRFSFGGTYTYQGEMYGGQPDSAAGFNAATQVYNVIVPDYEVVDLFLNHQFSDNLAVRLNIGNVTNETYWLAAYRSGSFMYLGDARSVRASLTWEL